MASSAGASYRKITCAPLKCLPAFPANTLRDGVDCVQVSVTLDRWIEVSPTSGCYGQPACRGSSPPLMRRRSLPCTLSCALTPGLPRRRQGTPISSTPRLDGAPFTPSCTPSPVCSWHSPPGYQQPQFNPQHTQGISLLWCPYKHTVIITSRAWLDSFT